MQSQVWQQNEGFSNPASRYQAYLNKLCLLAVLQWLQEEMAPQAKPWPSSALLPSFWELVNGSTITLDGTRFVLVPSQAMDMSELRVAQEWVDIPGWVGDYYLAVQVEPDEGYVRVWGYCTHEKLKSRGSYNGGDRTYSLDATDIISDMSVLAVARQLCPEEPTRTTVASLPSLTPEHAQNLISRLGSSQIMTPRLEIPFQLWGALVENGGWRQSLYQRRLGLPEQWSVLEWVNSGVSQLAEAIGWGSFSIQLSAALARSVQEIQPRILFSRRLVIAGQPYELRVTPMNSGESTIWRFELHNTIVGAAIPGGFKLRLLTEDLQPFPNNEDIATTAVEQLFVEVALAPGEGIVWEIEPLPENYDQEILKF
ncbi:MAG: DUF1822 family protein [Stigonema ocellatum SAG 48.90 = DSM 106950]|nr:DUF1822 family protein [Stigonema ocellatum SAG 48.90 = DSM 106950]